MAVGGLSNVVLSTIEKRFQFSSKEAGFIAASNDISAILLTSFVSFYGGYGNKPKWLGYGALFTGTCTVIFSEPFKPQYPHAYSPHCSLYISYVNSWENLIKHQHISCLVIISFILLTCIFDQLVTL